jgi:hypothetical protein
MANLIGTINFDKTETIVSSHDTLEEANTAAALLATTTTRSTRHVFIAQGTAEEYEIDAYLDLA